MQPQPWYLENYWYVVATSQELTDQPLGRMVCGKPLVVFRRRSDGAPAVLDDRCPHRRYSLSKGCVVGDDIQCDYHGVRFAGSGKCTFIPGQEMIPPTFRATSYSVVERYAMVWVWIGEGEPDPALIPADLATNDAPDWRVESGVSPFAAHYLLALDNSLDLTHLVFVHKTTLTTPQIVGTRNQVELHGETSFRTGRVMSDVDTPPMLRAVTNLPPKADRSMFTTFHLPGILVGDFRQAPPGGLGGSEESRTWMCAYFTPETERSTHFFWSQARSYAIDSAEVSKTTREMLMKAFSEDQQVLAEQQRLIDLDGGVDAVRLVNLAADNACATARRMIQRRMTAQRDSGRPAPESTS
jgi:phenylpropionate dioxygenase-like ring-hydroxylating dioxygenase large terminal subunit